MSPIVWISIFVNLFLQVWSQDPKERPEIISELEVTSNTIGGDATIRCSYRNKWESSKVQWVIKKKPPLFISLGLDIKATDKDKYSVADRTEDKVYISTLTIRNLTKTDSQLYSCVIRTQLIKSPRFWSKKDAMLTILEPPSIDRLVSKVTLSKGRVLLDPGESVQIECSASGNPKPSVYWARTDEDRQGQRLDGNSTMSLQNITETDTGIYMCFASNGVGKTANKSVFIGVTTDKIKCNPPNVNKKVCHKGENERLDIDFSVYGFPINDIELFKGSGQNKSLIVSMKTTSTRAELVDRESKEFDWNTSLYTLSMWNLTEDDLGSYFYKASINEDKECVASMEIKSLCDGTTSDPGNTGIRIPFSLSTTLATFVATLLFLL